MKYAIMSDVHAHPAALEKALKDARAVGCEKFILLGDITGYGYDPKRALGLVRENFDFGGNLGADGKRGGLPEVGGALRTVAGKV